MSALSCWVNPGQQRQDLVHLVLHWAVPACRCRHSVPHVPRRLLLCSQRVSILPELLSWDLPAIHPVVLLLLLLHGALPVCPGCHILLHVPGWLLFECQSIHCVPNLPPRCLPVGCPDDFVQPLPCRDVPARRCSRAVHPVRHCAVPDRHRHVPAVRLQDVPIGQVPNRAWGPADHVLPGLPAWDLCGLQQAQPMHQLSWQQ